MLVLVVVLVVMIVFVGCGGGNGYVSGCGGTGMLRGLVVALGLALGFESRLA